MRLLLTLQGLIGDCRAGTWPTTIPRQPGGLRDHGEMSPVPFGVDAEIKGCMEAATPEITLRGIQTTPVDSGSIHN